MQTTGMMPAPMLTAREVSAMCGVDKRTVYYWIQRGELEAEHNEFGQLRVNWFEAERMKREYEKNRQKA